MIKTRKDDTVDNLHGEMIADPYRWMEDLESAEIKQWVDHQNEQTFNYLDQIPGRSKINASLMKIFNYERFGMPSQRAGRYFYWKNDGLQNQSVLYTLNDLDGDARMLLDPNALSVDGTIALSGSRVSDDGKYLAYGLSASGSDWTEWSIRDIDSGTDLSDKLNWVKFSSASWDHNSSGFYYGRFAEPNAETAYSDTNFHQKLYYHLVGTPQTDDKLIYESPEHKEWMFGAEVTEDGNYLLISISRDTAHKNALYYKDLSNDGPVIEWLTRFDANYDYIGNDSSLFYFLTNKDAPQGQVIALDITLPQDQTPKIIIRQSSDTIYSVSLFGNRFIVKSMHDAHSVAKEYAINGDHVRNIELPGIGTVGGFGGRRSDKTTFYSYTSFTTPGTAYVFDIESSISDVFKKPSIDFDETLFETIQVFYPSKDGTRIPMFITSKKGIVLDGTNPAILYGYGGFNASVTPAFGTSMATWMNMGGIYAVANIRGGGEYGEEWHAAGIKEKKQNVFDDFIAAAEFLIESKYTSSPKLAIRGGSNGGLLVGACLTQRPDLFGAAIPDVGVMDMLRFHKFTIGWAWTSDYGNPDNVDDFKYLRAYSPLHNIKQGVSYPATMITTGDHDDRVVPSHSFKFAATLMEAQSGPAPILIRIDTKAGHGAGKPLSKVIDQQTDILAFLWKELGMK